MAQIIEITSLDQPGLEVYTSLTQAQLRNRLEPEKGVFIAESPKVIARALEAGCQPLSLLMERRQIEGGAKEIVARCGDVPLYTADREVLAGLTGYTLTRGVLCALRRPALPTVEQLCAGAKRLAVLENIVDSTNVGAIFRSAAALHMDGALDEHARSIDDPELAAQEKLAILLGTEGDGLAKTTIAGCDYTVCIPMSHGVDSLNVAAASAVAFWELRVR